MLSDGHRHQADRTAAEDSDGLAGDLLHEGGMDGVAHRLLESRDLGGEALDDPGVGLRDVGVLGEGARYVDTEDAQVLADVGASGPALVARPVDEVGLGGDELAERDAAGARPMGDDDAGHLVAEDHRRRAEVLLAHGSQRSMCTSVPQTLAASTRTSSSPGPGRRDRRPRETPRPAPRAP